MMSQDNKERIADSGVPFTDGPESGQAPAFAPRYIFDEYAAWTDTVAQYPPTAEPFYLALGIADEMGELAAATSADDLLKESGDVLWYIARYCTKVLWTPFSDAVLDSRRLGLGCDLNITRDIGIICGVEKKRIRDGAEWDARKRDIKHNAAYAAMIRLLWGIEFKLSGELYHLEDAVRLNKVKLSARLSAGTIKGDGDNR